ncbi:MAG: preprotein translocase subunit SecE [Patescibacteria group bacterium]
MPQLNQLTQYLKDSKNEMKKVAWPNKKEIRQHTILVITVSLGVAAFLGLIDYILTLGLERILIK